MQTFTQILRDAINTSIYYKPAHKRNSLPKFTVKLIRAKLREWLTGNIVHYKSYCRSGGLAIRQHTRCDMRLVYYNDRKAFFNYISRRIKKPRFMNISSNGVSLGDEQAANAFQCEFAGNFSKSTTHANCSQKPTLVMTEYSLSHFNCTSIDVKEAISCCSNSMLPR